MRIVEGSRYEHEEHGRVELLKAKEGSVVFVALDADPGVLDARHAEPLEDFEARTEPAAVAVGAPVSRVDAGSSAPGGRP